MYFFLPTASAFMTQTETWSGNEWDSTHWFLKVRLIVGCSLPGLIALVAFIDSTMQKAKERVNAGKETGVIGEETTLLTKTMTKTETVI
jgi:hypothetical protein